MDEMMKTMAASASGMAAQAARLRLELGEHRQRRHPRLPAQDRELRGGLQRSGDVRAVKTGPVRLDEAELVKVYDPTNPLAGADGSYAGLERQPVLEIADAREANRSYEANLRMFDQARQMASSLLGLLRR